MADGQRPVTTVSDQVEESYYGQPVIKAPHWRWLVILYFYLGGMAGASFTIGTVANLFAAGSSSRLPDRAVERAARYLSFAAVLPCPLLLVLDLGRPERAFNMFRVVKLKSPMSLGSWALLGLSLFSGALAGLQLLEDLTRRDGGRRARRDAPLHVTRPYGGLRRVLGIAGLPFSIFLSGYTGILLAATNVPLWWRAFPLLSPTFVSSAYSTSLAAISILLGLSRQEREDTTRKLARAEAICLSVELVSMTALLIRLGRIGRPLTTGRLGGIFWPVTYLGGVVVPLVLQVRSGLKPSATGEAVCRRATSHGSVRKGHPYTRIGVALLTLVGGFSLRALMIFAGRESANRPLDYFELTRKVKA